MSAARDLRRSELWRRFVAHRLAVAFGRHLVRCPRRFGDEATPDIDAPAFWIECATGRDLDPMLALLEAEAHARGSGLWPLAITKISGALPIVQMRLDDFIELVLEWWSARERRRAHAPATYEAASACDERRPRCG